MTKFDPEDVRLFFCLCLCLCLCLYTLIRVFIDLEFLKAVSYTIALHIFNNCILTYLFCECLK